MSQTPTWGSPVVADAPVTPTVVASRIDASFDALLSSHSGSARPSYAVAGTVWLDTDTDQWYKYDGTTDHPMQTEHLKSNTALSDAAATLTAEQLVGGLFTITPTAARIQTTDTAVNILAAMPPHVDGSSFQFTIANLAAFNTTLAAGTGVTLVGSLVANNASATFIAYRTSATTITVVRI